MNTKHKLIDSLDSNGKLFFEGKEISKENILSTIYLWTILWNKVNEQSQSTVKESKYTVFVGSSNIDFLFATLFASFHGLKLILANRANLSYILEKHRSNISIVISTLTSTCISHPIVNIPSPKHCLTSVLGLRGNLVPNPHQAEIVFCTSGTTSVQKLVVYDESVLFSNAEAVGKYLNLKKKKCLVFFPFNYMYGFATSFSTLIAGGILYLEETNIDIYQIFEYMTHIDVLPLIHLYVNQLKKAEKNLDFTRINPGIVVINASDTFYEDDLKYILKFSKHFWNNFGQTESGPRIFSCSILKEEYFINPTKFVQNGIVALGRPIVEDIKIELLDPDQTLSPNDGIMHYSTPFRMKGYLESNGGLSNQTERLSSNDVFTINSYGFYCFVSRKKNIIKENGRLYNLELINTHFTNRFKKVEHCRAFLLGGLIHLQLKLGIKVGKRSKYLEKVYGTICRIEYRNEFRNYPPLGKVNVIEEFTLTDTGKVQFSQERQLGYAV